MPCQILGVFIFISFVLFIGFTIEGIGTTNLRKGGWAFFWLCVGIGLTTWLTMANYQPMSYKKPINGVVVTAVTEDKQITATAVYDIDGKWYTIPLRGFLPAGVKVTIEKPNHLYLGIYYDRLNERIQIFDEEKVLQNDEIQSRKHKTSPLVESKRPEGLLE